MFFLNWLTADDPNSGTAKLKALIAAAVCAGLLAFLTGCGGDGSSGEPLTAAPCTLAVSGIGLTQTVSTPDGQACTLAVSGTGNTLNISAGSNLTDVFVSGDTMLIDFGAGSAVSGLFTLSGSGHTIVSLAADNIAIDADSSIGSQHIEN